MENKSIYYKSVLKGKAIKLKPTEKRETKREKFKKLKTIAH